jgi:four helix bundle protein
MRRAMEPPEAYTDRTFRFACQIVLLYRDLNKIPGFPFPLSRQQVRSGTSIGANVEEGTAAQSRRDLASRSAVALKESRETKYWLRLLLATDLAPKALVVPMLKEADELVAILTVTVRKLKKPAEG